MGANDVFFQKLDIPCDDTPTWSDDAVGHEQVVQDLFHPSHARSGTRTKTTVRRVEPTTFPRSWQGEHERLVAIQQESDRMHKTGLVHEQAFVTFFEEAILMLKGRPLTSLSEQEKIMVREKLAMGIALSSVQSTASDAIYKFVQVRGVQRPEETRVQDFVIHAVVQTMNLVLHVCLILCTIFMPILGVQGPLPDIPWTPGLTITASLVSMAWKAPYSCTRAVLFAALRGSSLRSKPVQRQTPLGDRMVYASQCLAHAIRHSSLPSQAALLAQLLRATAQHLDKKLGWSRMWSSTPLCLFTNTLCYLYERNIHLAFSRTVYAILESVWAAIDAYQHGIPP